MERTMNANNTTTKNSHGTANGREQMIALAREIRGEFAKIHALMAAALARAQMKKAA